MAADDLSTPLGQDKKKSRFRVPTAVIRFVPRVVAGLLALSLLVFVGWTLKGEDPLGGEPVAVVAATDLRPMPKVALEEPTPAGPRRFDGPEDGAPAAPGTRTINVIDGSTGKREVVTIPTSGDAGQGSPPVGDHRVTESSRHGPIPRVGPDGARPVDVYARPLKLAGAKAEYPRIAIVVTGLGIGSTGTNEALSKLPAAVSFAFAPYGTDLERLIAKARHDAHEVLLQVPMEPFDYPDNDPGPRTLLTTLAPEQNIDRLYWLMSRFQGYVGLSNYMGARFTATEPALGPVLREAAKRGLLYLDDGSSPRSLASQIAGAYSLPFAKAELAIDGVPTPVEIDRALARLETLARDRGTAVGVASALPATVERLIRWSKTLESRGFVLVPISAVANKAKET